MKREEKNAVRFRRESREIMGIVILPRRTSRLGPSCLSKIIYYFILKICINCVLIFFQLNFFFAIKMLNNMLYLYTFK
jgi:hypothetical protein